MTQALRQPVVVCVTSGSALLNLAPAVSEAYYQHRPLVVISADRPQQWIDQLDGQTIPQPNALGRFVMKAVSLPEPHDNEERWYCNRLVNEALLKKDGPVHINVPISEPLFNFTKESLPEERMIEWQPADISSIKLNHVAHMFMQAKRPMLISGQPMNANYDEAVMLVQENERYVPDFVLYIGGSIVSKRLKHFLRKAKEAWVVNETGEVTDTFMNLTNVIQGDGEMVADYIRFMLEQQPHPFVQQWDALLAKVRQHADCYEPEYSQMAAVKHFEHQYKLSLLRGRNERVSFHYANSTAIRLANIFSQHPVFCNRGVNGIEGSLSTAAGFSVVSNDPVFCVIGDLSFFYDQNALWNLNLKGNLRILLLNNGKGGIFNMLHGLEQSPARDQLVSAAHHTTAEGICQQNDVYYQQATNMEEMKKGVELLLNSEFSRPMVLEVFTDATEDERIYRDYYASVKDL
jgi:2-succinyl-5-enolpyruvyl-6-hydroxy-3-cyclohexene-1-carboxylate synthase